MAEEVIKIDLVAKMLRDMFNDSCACNYNGYDEWFWKFCPYANTECPEPSDPLACWRELVRFLITDICESEEITNNN